MVAFVFLRIMFVTICLVYPTLSCSNGVCPIFGTHNTATFPDKFADREIRDLTVICENKENGCKWNDRLGNYEVRNALMLCPILLFFVFQFQLVTLRFRSQKWIFNFMNIERKQTLKALSATFLLDCFLSLKESTCETRKKIFYFSSKALFVLEIIKF